MTSSSSSPQAEEGLCVSCVGFEDLTILDEQEPTSDEEMDDYEREDPTVGMYIAALVERHKAYDELLAAATVTTDDPLALAIVAAQSFIPSPSPSSSSSSTDWWFMGEYCDGWTQAAFNDCIRVLKHGIDAYWAYTYMWSFWKSIHIEPVDVIVFKMYWES